MIRRLRASLIFGLGILLLDRFVKVYVLHAFALGEVRPFIPGLLQLRYTQNTGMAFGFLGGFQWIPLVLTPLILVFLGWLLVRDSFPCPVQRLSMVSVMAGGFGNWADRLLYGFVVDMFEPTFVRFAVFNVADIFITMGVFVFIVAYLQAEWRAQQARRRGQAEPAEPSGE